MTAAGGLVDSNENSINSFSQIVNNSSTVYNDETAPPTLMVQCRPLTPMAKRSLNFSEASIKPPCKALSITPASSSLLMVSKETTSPSLWNRMTSTMAKALLLISDLEQLRI